MLHSVILDERSGCWFNALFIGALTNNQVGQLCYASRQAVTNCAIVLPMFSCCDRHFSRCWMWDMTCVSMMRYLWVLLLCQCVMRSLEGGLASSPPAWSPHTRTRDSKGISKLSLIHLILPHKISCILGSLEIPLLSLTLTNTRGWN